MSLCRAAGDLLDSFLAVARNDLEPGLAVHDCCRGHRSALRFQTKRAQARFSSLLTLFVGPLGIEPSLHAPEACVLPVYDGPNGF